MRVEHEIGISFVLTWCNRVTAPTRTRNEPSLLHTIRIKIIFKKWLAISRIEILHSKYNNASHASWRALPMSFDLVCLASEWIRNTVYCEIEIVYISKLWMYSVFCLLSYLKLTGLVMLAYRCLKKTIPESKSSAYFSIILISNWDEKIKQNRFASFWIRRGFDRVIHRWHGDAPVHPISLFVFAIQTAGTRTAYTLRIHMHVYCTRHFYSVFPRHRKYSNHIIIIIKRKCVRIAKKWKKKKGLPLNSWKGIVVKNCSNIEQMIFFHVNLVYPSE